MNALVKEIKEKAIEYGSIPFWSWNDKLDPDELRVQIRNMHDMEMRGFFMHARGGLETEYMSDEWFECVRACIDEAKKLGMEAWSYDENGWPSGFAGGELLKDPDNHAVFVEGEFYEYYPAEDENTVAVYAFDNKGIPTQTEASVDGCTKYLRIQMGKDGSYVDTMRADVVAKFIEATHEKYKERVGEDFGTAMPGFFTDEPQYYRWKTPFSTKMDEWFLDEYGYSVKNALPSLFCDYEGAAEYRYDYHKMTYSKFTSAFSKQIYEWAENNGIMITGHYIEEFSLSGQMLCCGDIMPQYLYEHIPGMDYLGRKMRGDVAAKQLGSVCAQTGRKKVLSEMFACCGWDVTPRELKSIAELQYSGGVNVMCQHLYPYSIRGQRKRDYPAFYSAHNLWQKHMKDFDRYFNNLGYMLSMGEEYADILVIHPIHSAWLAYKRALPQESMEKLDIEFQTLSDRFSHNQICYHYGSEAIMADMCKVEGRTVKLGRCSYGKVVIPPCDTLDATTVKLLKEFNNNGGRIYVHRHRMPTRIDGRTVFDGELDFLENCPDLDLAEVFESMRNDSEVIVGKGTNEGLRTAVRKTEGGRLIYISNLSENNLRDLTVTVNDCSRLGKLDILSLDVEAVVGSVHNGTAQISLDLYGYEAVVLFEQDAPEIKCEGYKDKFHTLKLKNKLEVVKLPDNVMTLDRVRVSRNGGEPSEIMPLERVRDELLRERFEGTVTLSFPFEIKELPTHLEVITEPFGKDSITVNGNNVLIGDTSAIDPCFKVTDITPYLCVGENIVEMTVDYYQDDYVYYVLYGGVSETLRNCLVFNTEIENIYLRGSFAVDTDPKGFIAEENNAYRYDGTRKMAVISQKSEIDHRNIVADGYPFYCGEVAFTTTVDHKKGDPTVLHLGGRYATVEIEVNGHRAGALLLSEYIDLANYLTEGENTLTLTICNNYRNLMGPHHRKTAEPLSVSPRTFSFENQWSNGECDEYDPRYSFVRFGIDT